MLAAIGKRRLVIKLGKSKLTVSSLSEKEIESQGYSVSNYPPKQAAKSYLRHGAGVSKRARRYLEAIASGVFSDLLLFA